AGRRVAVHAHHGHGLGRAGPVHVVELDHRVALVGVALGAGLDAGVATDAAARIDEELGRLRDGHRQRASGDGGAGALAFASLTAQTLYSGIFEIGSWAAIVRVFALFAPGQWYGMKTVSGRIVFTTATGSVIAPRRVSAVAKSPSARPSFCAS